MRNLFSYFFLISTSLILGCSGSGGTGGVGSGASNCDSGIKAPILAGVCGHLGQSSQAIKALSLAPAIAIPENSSIAYNNSTVDSEVLFQITSNLFTGFESLTGTVTDGETLSYAILPDGNGQSVPITVSVSINSTTNDITYLGTVDGVDNGFDGTNYHYNYFNIVLHSNNTFDYELIFFVDAYIVDDNGSFAGNNGWQWYAHSFVTGGTISGSNMDANGYTYLMQADTQSDVPVTPNGTTDLRYFAFVIKQRENIFGTSITPYAGADLSSSLNLIADKDISSYDASCSSIDHSDTSRTPDGYLYTDLNTSDIYSTFLAGQPDWVSTWWADNP